MGEYAKLLGHIMEAQKAGFHVEHWIGRPNRRPISQPGILLQAQPDDPLTNEEFILAGNNVKAILSDGLQLDEIRQAAYNTTAYIPRRFGLNGISPKVATVVLQWGSEALPPPLDLRLPYNGDDEGTYFGISVDIDPENASIAVFRRAAPDVLKLNEGGFWNARIFIQQPKMLLPAVARALNATLNRENQDR